MFCLHHVFNISMHSFVFLHPSFILFLSSVSLFLPSISSLNLNPTGLILCCSDDEASTEDQLLDQSHCSGPKAEVQPTSNDVDQEQQQRQELEEEPSDLDHGSNTSHHHQEQQHVVSKPLNTEDREVGFSEKRSSHNFL